ncbi:MAG: hypothetical protein L3J74_14255 [Bacteroidales bacterium]|nr:hypothetical protein [Bacteroidales bacterium]
MSQLFKSYEPEVEVNGQIIENFQNGLPAHLKPKIKEILSTHNLSDANSEVWFLEQDWLNALKKIKEKYGDNMFYDFAYQMQEQVKYQEHINRLELALMFLNMYQHEHHRGGEVGKYTLTAFDEGANKASIECKTVYPDDYNRAIITALSKYFKPEGALVIFVRENQLLPMRSNGDEQTTFNITWKKSATDLFS